MGHALLASGSYPYVSGIIQNNRCNRQSKRVASMLYDPTAKILVEETGPEDETSPRNFIGTTIGDEVGLSSPSANVVSLAVKGRGAMLLGGLLAQAYFMADGTGEMISSTYYMGQVRGRWLGNQPWQPLSLRHRCAAHHDGQGLSPRFLW